MQKLITTLEDHNVPFVTLFDRLYNAGDKMEQFHDKMMESERYYNKIEYDWQVQMQTDRIAITKIMVHENKDAAKQAKQRYKKHRQDELYKTYKTTEDPAEKKKIEKEIQAIESDRAITDIMIQQAKQYPIGQLIPVNRSHFAKCVSHTDSTPSMYCKNNFAHCFSCGYTGDVIDIYMIINNVGFQEAVRSLSD